MLWGTDTWTYLFSEAILWPDMYHHRHGKEIYPCLLVFERITLVDELAFRPRRVGTTQRACTSTSAYQFTKITPP